MSRPHTPRASRSHAMRGSAWGFVFYFSGGAAIVTFLVTLAIANKLADAKYRRELTPQAKQLR